MSGSNNVEVDPVTGVLKRDGAKSKMNPYDLYAVDLDGSVSSEHGIGFAKKEYLKKQYGEMHIQLMQGIKNNI